MYAFLLALLFLFCGQNMQAQVNYVRTWNATAPVNDPYVLLTKPISDVKIVTQYIDGLGR